MNRKLCQISDEVGGLLVKQAAHELKNFTLYMSFSNYFSLEGIVALEEYYYKRAEEEKLHFDWVTSYLKDADYRFKCPTIEENKEQVIENWLQPFIATVEREIETTQLLYKIYEVCQIEKDYMTCSWLYKDLIREQIEEESISRQAQKIMETDADIFIKSKRILNLLN